MYLGTPLDIKNMYTSSSYLSAYNSLLFRYKVCSTDPRESLCTQRGGTLKSMKTLAPCRKNPIENIKLLDQIARP